MCPPGVKIHAAHLKFSKDKILMQFWVKRNKFCQHLVTCGEGPLLTFMSKTGHRGSGIYFSFAKNAHWILIIHKSFVLFFIFRVNCLGIGKRKRINNQR